MATPKNEYDKRLVGGMRIVFKSLDTMGMTPLQITTAIANERTATLPSPLPPNYYTTLCGVEADYPIVSLREYPLIVYLWFWLAQFYAGTSNIIWLDICP